MMMKQQMPFPSEENMSSLSYYSAAAPSGEASSITHLSPPPPKKKRNLPGNPDPDAEVIGLSPKSLMATNRFICEICNKGFQRDQNLQLHKRGHNLPWKLKQRESINNDEVKKKKKVYVCPVITCVHHHPSRALGDLTGIKKHFYRKHGEKKWKCLKCSKRYAVQSDWKAHSKTCGTREYKCYCGTIFSRRDSFITHRAFCDALAEESSRCNPQAPSSNNNNIQFFNGELMFVKTEESMNPRAEIPPWLGRSGPQLIYDDHQDELASTVLVFHDQTQNPNPNTSATALLQKAAQMGAYSGNNSNLNLLSRDQVLSYSSLGNKAADIHTLPPPPPPPPSFFQEMILMSSGFDDDDDDDAFSSSYDMLDYKKLQDAPSTYFTHNHNPSNNYEVENNKNNNVGMSTRDFFGTKLQ